MMLQRDRKDEEIYRKLGKKHTCKTFPVERYFETFRLGFD